MKKVAIVMGSASDMNVVQPAMDKLKELGVEYTVRILSAHRTPIPPPACPDRPGPSPPR